MTEKTELEIATSLLKYWSERTLQWKVGGDYDNGDDFVGLETDLFVKKHSQDTILKRLETVMQYAPYAITDSWKWLNEPHLLTYNKTPISMLETESGFDLVMYILGSIEHGCV